MKIDKHRDEKVAELNRPQTDNGSSDQNLTHMAYRRIKEMMLGYDLAPGQRLIFADLAKLLDVSRTPVNNALSILANEGFLDFVPNQGYSVHQITREEANALYELREIIELGSIQKVIQRITPEQLDRLKTQKGLHEHAVMENGIRSVFIRDLEFHACYIEMVDNPYLTSYFRDIYQRILLLHRVEGLTTRRAKQVVLEHSEIFDAIRSENVKKARRLIADHIDAGREYVFSSFHR